MTAANSWSRRPQPQVLTRPLLNALHAAGLDLKTAAEFAGVNYAHIRDGGDVISVWLADRLAIHALARHPVEIYGHHFLDQRALLEEETRLRQEVAS